MHDHRHDKTRLMLLAISPVIPLSVKGVSAQIEAVDGAELLSRDGLDVVGADCPMAFPSYDIAGAALSEDAPQNGAERNAEVRA